MPDPVWQDHAAGQADASREVWGMLSVSGTVLFMSASVKNVLGWGVGEIIGMSLNDIVLDTSTVNTLGAALHRAVQGNHGHVEVVECRFRQKSGSYINLNITLHPLPAGADAQPELRQLPIVCQIRPLQTKSTVDRQLVTSISQGNVFSDAPKEGSWQFELQQLKLKNQELAAEIEFLEGSVGLQKQQPHQATSTSASSSSTHKSAEWTSHHHHHHHHHHPLKRR
jgi:PAS domain S-box-containing protein